MHSKISLFTIHLSLLWQSTIIVITDSRLVPKVEDQENGPEIKDAILETSEYAFLEFIAGTSVACKPSRSQTAPKTKCIDIPTIDKIFSEAYPSVIQNNVYECTKKNMMAFNILPPSNPTPGSKTEICSNMMDTYRTTKGLEFLKDAVKSKKPGCDSFNLDNTAAMDKAIQNCGVDFKSESTGKSKGLSLFGHRMMKQLEFLKHAEGRIVMLRCETGAMEPEERRRHELVWKWTEDVVIDEITTEQKSPANIYVVILDPKKPDEPHHTPKPYRKEPPWTELSAA
jgi:hypothetical protein